jgi:hypothetical protein
MHEHRISPRFSGLVQEDDPSRKYIARKPQKVNERLKNKFIKKCFKRNRILMFS